MTDRLTAWALGLGILLTLLATLLTVAAYAALTDHEGTPERYVILRYECVGMSSGECAAAVMRMRQCMAGGRN